MLEPEPSQVFLPMYSTACPHGSPDGVAEVDHLGPSGKVVSASSLECSRVKWTSHWNPVTMAWEVLVQCGCS